MQQCHALVKVCPKLFRIDHNGSVWWMREGYETATDPLHDLNAIVAACDSLADTEIPGTSNIFRFEFPGHLYHLLKPPTHEFNYVNATAKQRVEALLRTYGEWKE